LQIGVKKKASSRIPTLVIPNKNGAHVQVESLEGLNERLTEARVRADSLAVQVQDSQERREGSRIQLLTSQARELQYLMEEEIEANNYEAAALLQVGACMCQVCD
jgi:hypothetical protein